jgi:hypothetical protein
MRTLRIVTAAIAALLGASSARAALVDFTSNAWVGQSTIDYGSLRVRVAAAGGAIVTTVFDGTVGAPPCTPATLACQTDGLGIGAGDDEVTFGGSEVLVVSFWDLADSPVAVSVLGIHFFDLFQSLAGADANPETAQWRYDVGGGGQLTGTEIAAGTGWAFAATGAVGVHEIRFFATAPLSSANTDFALAALDVEQPVPEPATVALLGAGLMALGLRRGRRP